MLPYLRLLSIVQKFAKQFSTHAQRNYKLIELGVTGSSGQYVPSTVLKQTQSVNEPASRNYRLTLLNFLGGSKQNENLLIKHNQITKLKSRNYKIPTMSEFRKSGRKRRYLLKKNQFLNELTSRDYKVAILGAYMRSDRNKNCLLRQNLVPTEVILRSYKVALVGGAGGIGQNLALLLKLNPLITTLALYDPAKVTPGVAVDLSHINTHTRVTGLNGPRQLCDCLSGACVVVVTAGQSRPTDVATTDDLFKINAPIASQITKAIAHNCPRAIVSFCTNPINSIIPLANEIMNQRGIKAEARILGITTIDMVRAAMFVSQLNCSDPNNQWVPVVGGNGTGSVVPLLSQSSPPIYLDDITRRVLTQRIQVAGAEVVAAKLHSSTLSMGYAAARFTNSVLRGLRGDSNVVEFAFVKQNVEECTYFTGPVVLGQGGVKSYLGIGEVNYFEKELLKAAAPIIQKNVQIGIDYVTKKITEKC